MSCQRLAGGAIVCNRTRPRPKCQARGCRRGAIALCDHNVGSFTRPATCDARLCDLHRVRCGPDEDRCPYHADAKARQLDLFARAIP